MDQLESAQAEQQSAPPSQEPGSVLALGVEVHRLTACLLEPVRNQYRLAAWWIAPSGLQRSVAEQIEAMCRHFGRRIQRRLWHRDRAAPFTVSPNPVAHPPLQHVVIAASPRPPLRVWIAGITEHNSLAAGVGALEASQVDVVGRTSLGSESEALSLAHDLNASRPEALVITGGYDSHMPDPQPAVLLLAQKLASALRDLPDDAVPEIIFAGNRFAYREVAAILQAARRCSISRVENVLPAPGQAHVQELSQAANGLYWQKCCRMRGFSLLEEWNTAPVPIMTVESSFARLVQIWMQLNDLTGLHGVYRGRDRQLHVWADAGSDRILARFTTPGAYATEDSYWPPVRLVSGPSDGDNGLPDSVLWWDASGLSPVVAAAAHVSPQAAVDVLRADLLSRR